MQPTKIAALAEEALSGRKPDLGMARLVEKMTDLTVGINGSGEVCLLDERGLRVLQRQPFENFVAVPALNYLKWAVRRNFSTIVTNASGTAATALLYTEAWNGAGSDTDMPAPGRTIGAVFLTDSTATEASSTEVYMPGNIIGAASQNYSTASVGNRGTMTTASSTRSSTSHTHRYEWATSQANGAINSVGWACDAATSRMILPTTSALFPIASTSSQWFIPFPEHPFLNDWVAASPSSIRAAAVRQSDGLVLTSAVNTATVLQLTTSPFANPRTTTTTIPTATSAYGTAAFSICDMSIDSTNLWYTAIGSPYAIKKETLGSLGSTTASFAKPWAGSNPGLIAANSTHLFVTEIASANLGTANRTIYKLAQSDGSTATSWTHDISARGGLTTNASIVALVWDYTNSLLGVVDSSGSASCTSSNGATCFRTKVTWYDSSGTFVYVSGLMGGDNGTSPLAPETGLASYPRIALEYGGYLYVSRNNGSNYIANMHQVANLGTRTKLGATVTKTSSNSLRVDYVIAFS